MPDRSSLERLLAHGLRLASLTNADEILAASSRELVAETGTRRAFASCRLLRQAWELGLHVEADRSGSHKEVSPAARSALFAIHRRLAHRSVALEISRDDESATIFRGLACDAEVHTLHAYPLVHRTGRLWGAFVLLASDSHPLQSECVGEIAQQTTVALQTAQRLAFARRDQDRLLLLAEATDDALYDYDFVSGEFWWGGGILRMLGSNSEPVQNSQAWKERQIHPEDIARVCATFQAALDSRVMRWNAEYRFRRHDGSYVDVEDRSYFLRDVSGRATRVIGSMRDVSAMKRSLAREQEARAEAENASRAKDEFLAMLGHELRNPLAPIVTALDLLHVRGSLDPEKDVPVLQRQAQNLVRLVDDLLDTSRIAHGKIELQKQRLEISSVVAAAIEMASPLIATRLHTIEAVIPPHGLEVFGDSARLAQALANLLMNAAKYTEPHGRITVIAERSADTISIAVRDTGTGIEPTMLPRIFNMFEQERQSLDRSRGGLGLGLSIVRNLVELHGGTVEARSDGRGSGSEFTIRLPAAATCVGETAAAILPVVTPTKRKIMVVDDNEDAAELLSALLEQLGNTTRVAYDAKAALRIVDEFLPDLAVLDIGLPQIDGYELARQLCERLGSRRPHLIALTGYGQAADKERSASAGFNAHLVKPVRLQTLQAVITQLVPLKIEPSLSEQADEIRR